VKESIPNLILARLLFIQENLQKFSNLSENHFRAFLFGSHFTINKILSKRCHFILLEHLFKLRSSGKMHRKKQLYTGKRML